jgi:hypothetical protein
MIADQPISPCAMLSLDNSRALFFPFVSAKTWFRIAHSDGFPIPIKIGRARYLPIKEIEAFFLSQPRERHVTRGEAGRRAANKHFPLKATKMNPDVAAAA